MKNFHTYYLSISPEDREQLAQDCGTSTGYLSQIANGHRRAGAGLIDRLMTAGRKDIVKLLRPSWFDDSNRDSAA